MRKFLILFFSLTILLLAQVAFAQTIFFPSNIHADENYLYVSYNNGTIKIWEKPDWQLKKTVVADIRYDPTFYGLYAFHVDDDYLYAGSDMGELRVFNHDGNEVYRSEFGIYNGISSIKSDENFFYVGLYEKRIEVLDKRNFKTIKTLDCMSNVADLEVDETYVYCLSKYYIEIFEKENWDLLNTLSIEERVDKHGYAFEYILLEDGLITVKGVNKTIGEIQFWNRTSLIKILEMDTVYKKLFSDENYFYTASFYSITVWTKEGNVFGIVNSTNRISRINVDEDFIYIGTYNSTLEIRDKNTHEIVKVIGEAVPYEETVVINGGTESEETANLAYLLLVSFLCIFFILILVIRKRRETGKWKFDITKSVSINDIIFILLMATAIITVITFLNREFLVPFFSPNLEPVYYMDVFVKKGPFKIVWFLLWPVIGYRLFKSRMRRKVAYLVAFMLFLLSVLIYFLAPSVPL